MKKLLTITAAILCASALVVSAQETNKPAKKAENKPEAAPVAN